MIKEFLMKKVLKSKLKDVPPAEQEKIIAMVEKNPEFFNTIAGEIQAKMKQGKDQMAATMEVMREHEAELRRIM
jgi:uncharacterized protein YneF (UPF0154 family)